MKLLFLLILSFFFIGCSTQNYYIDDFDNNINDTITTNTTSWSSKKINNSLNDIKVELCSVDNSLSWC